jgi:Spy/CpxP family protein refolding chaperone
MTTPARGSTRLKILLVLVGVFLLGGVTGASLASFYRLRGDHERPERRRGGGGGRREDKIFESMRRDLSLTEQQATEIRTILDQTRNDYRALRAEVRPRYDAVRQNARTRIRALLTPEQQKLFDAHAAARDARREDDEK